MMQVSNMRSATLNAAPYTM